MMKERTKRETQTKVREIRCSCGQGERLNVINEPVSPQTQSNTEDVEETGRRVERREEADDCNCIPDPTSFICPRESWIRSLCLGERSQVCRSVIYNLLAFALLQPFTQQLVQES